MTSEIEYQCNNCGHEGINTRAVSEGVHTAHIPSPDVPELVRYSNISSWDDMPCEYINEDINGEYVLYSQAAEIIAAKDAEIERLRKKLRQEFQLGLTTLERAEAAEAKLAQIKAQVPYGYIDGPHFSTEPIEGWIPLYAAPVDQTAEIERYRKALTLIANKKAGLDLHDARDISRAALSGKEPS